MPKVSVIIPVYKAEKVIRRCINSVLMQTFEDFELILVDDGSPDNCAIICDEYKACDNRIRVIHQPNSGVSSARNAGIDIATGEYILFVDSDDYVNADYISCFLSHESDLTICGLNVLRESGELLYSVAYCKMAYSHRSKIEYGKLYEANLLYSPYCKLFSNEIIRNNNLRFPLNVNWGEDGMFVADYLHYVHSLEVIDYIGYNYIKYDDEDSLSTRIREDVIDMIGISREYCIRQMMTTSPFYYDTVKRVCTEDLRKNMTYFIRKLFDNTNLTCNQKIKVLRKYMQNSNVLDIFNNAEKYFSGSPAYLVALAKNNAISIVYTYYIQVRKRRILEKIYTVYSKMPHWMKSVYRKLKNR